MRSWEDRKTKPRWQKWKRLDSVGSSDQPRTGAAESTAAGRSSPRRAATPPTKGPKEKREAPEAANVPKQSPKRAPPLPPSTGKPSPPEEPPKTRPSIETREERPGRRSEDSKRQWGRQEAEIAYTCRFGEDQREGGMRHMQNSNMLTM